MSFQAKIESACTPAKVGSTDHYSPLVSVVIATYNMGRYVGKAVRSVLEQTYRNLELHVVDDGSTDDTPRVLDEFESDARFHRYRQENAGQAVARNRGLSRCRGDLVAFLDADDMWPEGRLEKQVPHFTDDPELGVVYGQLQGIDSEGNILPPSESIDHSRWPSGWVTERLFQDNCIPFGSVLVRRECFDRLGGFDESLRMGDDWDLWLRFSTRYKFLYLPEVMLKYRWWEGQMSRNWKGRYEHAERIMDNFVRRFPNALSRAQKARGYAFLYLSRARALSYIERQNWSALVDCWRAFRLAPTLGRVYMQAASILLALTGVRDPRP